MRILPRFAAMAPMAFLLFACAQSPQQQAINEQQIVDSSTLTVQQMEAATGAKTANLLKRAKAVLVFPSVVKGGLIIGGENGEGVLSAHGAAGWSDPAFYQISAISVGLQAGGEDSQVVMFVLTDKAYASILRSNSYTVKAGAGLNLVDFNTAKDVDISGADVVVWSKNSGVFGGLTVSGSDIKQRFEHNAVYYGKGVNAVAIITGKATNPKAGALRRALAAG
jgi:lipid-binding SYLF domain-containing protein